MRFICGGTPHITMSRPTMQKMPRSRLTGTLAKKSRTQSFDRVQILTPPNTHIFVSRCLAQQPICQYHTPQTSRKRLNSKPCPKAKSTQKRLNPNAEAYSSRTRFCDVLWYSDYGYRLHKDYHIIIWAQHW